MKRGIFLSVCVGILFAACGKKGTKPVVTEQKIFEKSGDCGQEAITKLPVKVGETGIALPVGTKLCITADNLEGRVELPPGYTFITASEGDKMAPAYASYSCTCSESKNSCMVIFAESLGFGCLQKNCTGSCTGKFTINGYKVERVVPTIDKLAFFSLPEVQTAIRNKRGSVIPSVGSGITADLVYVKQQVFGVSFYLLLNKNAIPASLADAELLSSKAVCNCKAAQSCKLETVTLPFLKGETGKFKIYFCDGSCNGCELTVD